jgi:two-component system alkaline phosphatase synthesis response regulator PhoP
MIEQKKKKILIIDDSFYHLKFLEKILENEYEIVMAESGIEAINFIENYKLIPDLILLDLVMPLMDGWDVLRELRRFNSIENVPIVLMSSAYEKEIGILKEAFGTEVDGYIQKSISTEELLEKIKRYLLE